MVTSKKELFERVDSEVHKILNEYLDDYLMKKPLKPILYPNSSSIYPKWKTSKTDLMAHIYLVMGGDFDRDLVASLLKVSKEWVEHHCMPRLIEYTTERELYQFAETIFKNLYGGSTTFHYSDENEGSGGNYYEIVSEIIRYGRVDSDYAKLVMINLISRGILKMHDLGHIFCLDDWRKHTQDTERFNLRDIKG